MPYQRELLFATEAVRKASLLTKKIQRAMLRDHESPLIKKDHSPVTLGDYSAQAIIINAIKVNFPQDEIIAEEDTTDLRDSFLERILTELRTGDDLYNKLGRKDIEFTNSDYPLTDINDLRKIIDLGNSKGGEKGRFWSIDPIDGTKGFVRGQQFAVCLGLIVDGSPVLGVIGCPNLRFSEFGDKDITEDDSGYIFKALSNCGTTYSPTLADDWRTAKCNVVTDTSKMTSLESYEKSHSSRETQQQIKSKLQITRTFYLDSQTKYCLLAAGVADLYLRLPKNNGYQEKIWDHAPGSVILHEAGGVVSDALSGDQLDFSRGRYLYSNGIVASCGGPALHRRIVDVSSDAMKSLTRPQ
ncbi:HGL215Wp [Eremothecium sinecaudum]|uniref:3'(2'),5'-bisphosphate nucleotidase n=1 Tax=Eremothecium sinecaudum TaxID=45286 RepID=A0A120K2N8_9SACH|nr:HGL215Wp [Eremothecium sinecaudum]AMD22125.1 HGL215Wp [Eremothecium sinecaudum]